MTANALRARGPLGLWGRRTSASCSCSMRYLEGPERGPAAYKGIVDLTLIRRELESHKEAAPLCSDSRHTPRGPYALTETIRGEAVE